MLISSIRLPLFKLNIRIWLGFIPPFIIYCKSYYSSSLSKGQSTDRWRGFGTRNRYESNKEIIPIIHFGTHSPPFHHHPPRHGTTNSKLIHSTFSQILCPRSANLFSVLWLHIVSRRHANKKAMSRFAGQRNDSGIRQWTGLLAKRTMTTTSDRQGIMPHAAHRKQMTRFPFSFSFPIPFHFTLFLSIAFRQLHPMAIKTCCYSFRPSFRCCRCSAIFRRVLREGERIVEPQLLNGSSSVNLSSSDHRSFCDWPFVLPSFLGIRINWTDVMESDAAAAVNLATYCWTLCSSQSKL